MNSDHKFWISVWSVIGLTIVSIVAVVADFNKDANEKIRAATTCEAAVLIQGGQAVQERLLACALKEKNQQSNDK